MLGGLNNKNLLSHNFVSHKSEIKVLTELAPSKGYEGRIGSSLHFHLVFSLYVSVSKWEIISKKMLRCVLCIRAVMAASRLNMYRLFFLFP